MSFILFYFLLQKVSRIRAAMDHFARRIDLVLQLCLARKKLKKMQSQREYLLINYLKKKLKSMTYSGILS